MPLIKLRLINPPSSDLARVIRFYDSHKSDELRPRPPEMFEKAADQYQLFIIETDQRDIVAAGAVFTYEGFGDLVTSKEIGADRVVLNGFGLQKILLCARTVSDYLLDYLGCPFFAIARPETASYHNLVKLDYRPAPPPAGVLECRAQILNLSSADMGGKCFLEMPPTKVAAHAARLAHLMKNPILRARHGADQVELHFESIIFESEGIEKTLESLPGARD